jgi:sensor domain CHASE-containing protein
LENIRLEASAAQNQTKNTIAESCDLESTLQTKIAEIKNLKTELEESQTLNSKIWAEMSALKIERTKMSDDYTALASDLDTLTVKLQNSEKSEESL